MENMNHWPKSMSRGLYYQQHEQSKKSQPFTLLLGAMSSFVMPFWSVSPASVGIPTTTIASKPMSDSQTSTTIQIGNSLSEFLAKGALSQKWNNVLSKLDKQGADWNGLPDSFYELHSKISCWPKDLSLTVVKDLARLLPVDRAEAGIRIMEVEDGFKASVNSGTSGWKVACEKGTLHNALVMAMLHLKKANFDVKPSGQLEEELNKLSLNENGNLVDGQSTSACEQLLRTQACEALKSQASELRLDSDALEKLKKVVN